MNNRRSYRSNRTYEVENDASSVNNEQHLKLCRNSETSDNMDVSPLLGMRNFQTSETSNRRSFRTRVAETRKSSTSSFSYRKNVSSPYHEDENDESARKISDSSRRSSYRSSYYSFQPDSEFEVEVPTHKDPKEEAMALLTELAENEGISDETSEILKVAVQQITKKSETVVGVNQLISDDTKSHSTSTDAKKTKSAEKTKESLSAADLKERILAKVPMILHSDGLYAYNGRTYVAINDPSQLVGIVINMVDEKMFGLTSTNIFSSILTMLQVDEKLKPDDYTERLIASENIVVFKNTLLDVRTLKKIPFNPWYITNYEIDANYINHPEPEVFAEFLNTSSGGDPEIEARIADCISYMLAGTNRGKFFCVLGNAPDSGKSSLAAFLQGIINEKYIFNVAPNELKDKFALGGHKGRILNISMDLPSSKLHPEVVATIKKITGGDRLMSQEKNEKKEFGVSSLRLMYGSNHPVTVTPTDDNDSFWSRLEVIPFTVSVPDDAKDPHLVQKLLDERDEIVSYCIQRFPDIIERGYKLSPCQVAEDIKEEWRYGIPDSDSLESFCDTFLEITGNKEDVILATDVYTPYREYCKSLGVKPLREEKIKDWFNDHGGECDRGRLPGMKNAQSLIYGVCMLKDIN